MTHLTPEALDAMKSDLAKGYVDQYGFAMWVPADDLAALISSYEAMRKALKELSDTVRAELDVEPCVGSMAPMEHARGIARAALPPPPEGQEQ